MALGSLGLRIALPVFGAVFGSSISKGCPNSSDEGYVSFCIDLGYAGEGFVIGMVTASVIDIAFLSWSPKKTAYSSPRPLALSLSPLYDPRSGNSGLSLLGTF